MAEALRELNLLRLKRDLELPSIMALLFFHQATEHVDYQEIHDLTELVTTATERASDCSLLLAAQFHLYTYSGIVLADEKANQQRLETSRSFLTKVKCSVRPAGISRASAAVFRSRLSIKLQRLKCKNKQKFFGPGHAFALKHLHLHGRNRSNAAWPCSSLMICQIIPRLLHKSWTA